MRQLLKKRSTIRWFFILSGLISWAIWCFLFLTDVGSRQYKVFVDGRYDWFMDLYNVVYYSLGRSPYSWGAAATRMHFPLAYLLYYPLTYLYPYDITD